MSAQIIPQQPNYPRVRIAIEDFSSHLEGLENELEEAGSIVLMRGERVVAEVKPLNVDFSAERRPFRERMPDFEAQLKEIFGDQVFPDSTPLIRADRDGE